jgi:tRNA(Ile)-lysidine synthase
MPALAREGLTAARLARLADRVRRAEAALDHMTDAAQSSLRKPWPVPDFLALPAEIRVRLLRRAVAALAHEGAVELGRLETLADRLVRDAATGRFAATLAGVKVSIYRDHIRIVAAPARKTRRLADGHEPKP